MSKNSNYENRSNKIHVPLPHQAETMREIVDHASKELYLSLKSFPEKVSGNKRWITTGRIDFRPGGSVDYFVSYEQRYGYTG